MYKVSKINIVNIDNVNYAKVNKLSDTLIFKNPIYVNKRGDVFSFKNGKLTLKTKWISKRGYYDISHEDHTISVHRIMKVGFFNIYDSKLFINHKDGNKLNNNLSNLEITTCLENTHHALLTGLSKGTPITDSIINGVRNMVLNNKHKYTISEISRRFNISYISARRIIEGDTKRFSSYDDISYYTKPHIKFTMLDLENSINYIISHHNKSIRHYRQNTKFEYDTVKKVLYDIKNCNTTTKVFGRVFTLSKYSTAIS